MAARAWATATDKTENGNGSSTRKSAGGDGAIFFQNDAVSLCLLVQRRSKTMRVIDFRAGPTPAKRTLVLALARREGVEKIYTVVERDEVATWVKLGFAKEGNIPAFYKRSDAFLLGCSIDDAPESKSGPPSSSQRVPVQSERRLIIQGGPSLARASIASRAWLDLERVPLDDVEAPADTTAYDFAEKTLIRAKKLVKEAAERALPAVKLSEIAEAQTRKPIGSALRSGRALTAFEPFGRGAIRRYFALTARGGFELVASAESQACFGNAFLELLVSPRNDSERAGTTGALKALCERLQADGTVGCFALAPSDDASLSAAFVYNGFRRTGVLQNHLVVGRERKDAIVFARKLANPADE
ncbi:hypothetical protein [Pendulispora albinea]|uniref:N-acetyltransferase domain-containing protein n=1 Tax=Pendulispora albinea TaxID=2741071 RepID=A0ABZ2LX74_9BACT